MTRSFETRLERVESHAPAKPGPCVIIFKTKDPENAEKLLELARAEADGRGYVVIDLRTPEERAP